MTKKCHYPSLWHGKCLFVFGQTKDECQSDGGSTGRLFLLSQTWDLRRTCLYAPTYPGLTRALATGGIQGCLCVREENTNKGMNLMSSVICEEKSCLSITNQTHHYAVLGPLAYANRWKRGRFLFPRWQLCCGRTGESAVDREVSCFCTAELTFIITDGQNEPASG